MIVWSHTYKNVFDSVEKKNHMVIYKL